MTDSTAELRLTKPPVMTTGMLIRRSAADVFEAFVDPAITTRFWFTDGSGRLEAGKQVVWTWGMYGVSADVDVLEIEPNRRILIEWPDMHGKTQVEWTFDERPDGTTFVTITNTGFSGDGDAIVAAACDSTQGFSFVLAGVKALLEHGVELNLVADHAPDAHVTPAAAE